MAEVGESGILASSPSETGKNILGLKEDPLARMAEVVLELRAPPLLFSDTV